MTAADGGPSGSSLCAPPAPEHEGERFPFLGGELEPAGGGHRRPAHLADHSGEAAVAKPFLHHRQNILVAVAFGVEDPVREEGPRRPGRGRTGNRRLRSAQRTSPGRRAATEARKRIAAASSAGPGFVPAASFEGVIRKAAAGQPAVDRLHAEGEARAFLPRPGGFTVLTSARRAARRSVRARLEDIATNDLCVPFMFPPRSARVGVGEQQVWGAVRESVCVERSRDTRSSAARELWLRSAGAPRLRSGRRTGKQPPSQGFPAPHAPPPLLSPRLPDPRRRAGVGRGDSRWFYKDTDIQPDPAWTFGTLPNGLRYAVRRNAVPEGQVSVRLRIDAGSLHEAEKERGWAHFVEHMAFRGTKDFADGEVRETWQRLGASFGSDTNASTEPTQTVYMLDLPHADRASLDTSLALIADMADTAVFDPKIVEAERGVVLSEYGRRTEIAVKLRDMMNPLFFGGLKYAQRDTIGTEATLKGADPAGLKAFYERWYRPDRATLVMVGDADPKMMEELIAARFGGWKASGAAPAEPDYGSPADSARRTAAIAYPALLISPP